MSRVCELTGTDVLSGNNVSHSNRKTRRKFRPNLRSCSFYSEALRVFIKLRVNMRGLRTVDKHGGLDNFLMDVKQDQLSERAKKIKRAIEKRKPAEGRVKVA